jgi:hypothetical protein
MLTCAECCLDGILPFLFVINCKRISDYTHNKTYNLTNIISALM